MEDPVGAQPADQVDRQVGQQIGQADHVVAGIEGYEHVRVAVAQLPGRVQAADQVTDLGGGDLGEVVVGT